MSTERWKNVIGYEGLYQVSDMGRVKSLFYDSKIGYEKIRIIKELLNEKITISKISQMINIDRLTIRRIKNNYYKEKILKPWKNANGNGYRLIISLSKNKKRKRFYVHILVAEAFIGPCPPNMECCHNDGNGENNLVSNLRYGTHKENMEDMILHGNSNLGIKNPNCKLTEEQILEIIDLINSGILLQEIANTFNVSVGLICNIKNRKLWLHLTQNIRINRKKIQRKSNRGNTKLTDNDLTEIKMLIGSGFPSSEIALKFNVSFNTINRIRKNITFRSHV